MVDHWHPGFDPSDMMRAVASDLPPEVVRFLAEFVDSASLLDVLLLLRATPDKEWTPAEVARALVSTEEAARAHLRTLVDSDLASEEAGSYLYSPAALGGIIDTLADCYAKRRHTVIGVIYGGDTGPATTLSDAFRIRRRKRDG